MTAVTNKQRAVELCSPSCPLPLGYVVQDADELHPAERSCLVHLGQLVGLLVGRYGAVTVERSR